MTESVPNNQNRIVYTVKKGDTLGRIRQNAASLARTRGQELGADQTVANIAHQSRIKDPNKIQVGDKIVIDTVTLSAPAGPAAGKSEFKSFLSGLKAKYEGKLKGNPELQAQFLAEVNSFVNAHFMAGYEGGKQIDIDDNFVLTADNVSRLATGIDPKDGEIKTKADCGLFAQAYKLCFQSAGLQTKYFGSYINAGSVRGGHVQVAGYLPGDKTFFMTNNASARLIGLAYNQDNGGLAAQRLIRRDFGDQATIYGTIPGAKRQSEITDRLAAQAARHETAANLENGLRSYRKYASGLQQIGNLTSKEQFLAAISAYKARTGDTLNNVGFTPEEQAKAVLSSYLAVTDTMDGLLADVKELRGRLDPKKDFPLTVRLGGHSLDFRNPKELDSFISQKTTEIATYKHEINRSIRLFS